MMASMMTDGEDGILPGTVGNERDAGVFAVS